MLSRGFCSKHYTRKKRRGEFQNNPVIKKQTIKKKCSAIGCSDLDFATGLCKKHYHQEYSKTEEARAAHRTSQQNSYWNKLGNSRARNSQQYKKRREQNILYAKQHGATSRENRRNKALDMLNDLRYPKYPVPQVNEDNVKRSIIEKLEEIGLVVYSEFKLPGPTKKIIDLFIPQLNLGVELKLGKIMNRHIHADQINKYSEHFSEENLVVVSLDGSSGLSPQQFFSFITKRLAKLESYFFNLASLSVRDTV